MKIKNHDDFPKLDHQTAPSFRAKRHWVIDSPPIPRARLGDRRHDQLGNFQTALLGSITPASTHQRHQRGRRGADPVGQRRHVEINAFPRIDGALTIERQMQAILGEQDVGEQLRPGPAARDRV
jgi:hypothetical protein